MTNAGALWLSAARTRKDAGSWLRANAAMMDHARRHHLGDIQLQLMLDLAMALECAGRNHDIAPAYEAALAQAYKSAGKARVASIHRNFAAYLRDDKPEEAHRHLKLALDQARQSGDDYELGSCLTALGIFVQHAGDVAAAKPLLQEALQRMRTDHEFYLYARNHMQAINDGGKCGCGNMQATIAQTLTDMVQSKLPAGLLESIHLKDDGDLDIKLKREPTPDEMDLLNTVVRSAMAELRNASSKS